MGMLVKSCSSTALRLAGETAGDVGERTPSTALIMGSPARMDKVPSRAPGKYGIFQMIVELTGAYEADPMDDFSTGVSI